MKELFDRHAGAWLVAAGSCGVLKLAHHVDALHVNCGCFHTRL